MIRWALVFSFSLSCCSAAVIHVNSNLTVTGDGLSWATAYTTVQEGLASAVSGDELWIASGTYFADAADSGNREASFVVPDGVSLIGGFAGTELLSSERDALATHSVLSGAISVDPSGWSYNILEVENVYLEKLEITSANADGPPGFNRGAAVAASGNVVVVDCIFSSLSADFGGGAFFNTDVRALNCVFRDNVGGQGGVIYSGSLEATNCLFLNNEGALFGGVSFNTDLTLVNSTLFGNFTRGAGSIADDGSIVAFNTLFADDRPFRNVLANFSNAKLVEGQTERGSNIFLDADIAGVGITEFADYGDLSYFIFLADRAAIQFVSETNISGVDGILGTADDGLRLTASSPAIDAGNGLLLPEDEFDREFDGIVLETLPVDFGNFRRIQDAAVDIGAYEFGDDTANTFPITLQAGAGGTTQPAGEVQVGIGETLLVSAVPSPGYLFDQWSGDLLPADNQNNPLSTVADQARILVASFIQDLADNDSDGLTNYEEEVIYGSDPGKFDTSGDGINDGDAVAAGLDPTVDYSGSQFVVTLTSGVGGTTTPSGSVSVVFGGSLPVVANPTPGYLFSTWSGDVPTQDLTSAAITLSVDQNLAAEAIFTADLGDDDGDGLSNFDELVTYNTDPVLADSNSDGVEDGDAVAAGLDPTVDYGPIISVIIADPETFGVPSVERFHLDLYAELGGEVFPGESREYDGDSTVLIEADVDPGYVFQGWTGSFSSTENPLTVTMVDNVTLTATIGQDLADGDFDGLTNYQELQVYNTDPAASDTSGDSIEDGRAVLAGLDPLYDHRPFLSFLQQNSSEFGVIFDGDVDYSSLGEVLLTNSGDGTVNLSVDIEQSNDLTGQWQTIGTIEQDIPIQGDRKFFRLSVTQP